MAVRRVMIMKRYFFLALLLALGAALFGAGPAAGQNPARPESRARTGCSSWGKIILKDATFYNSLWRTDSGDGISVDEALAEWEQAIQAVLDEKG